MTKTVANMATFPPRSATLREAVSRIIGQVDILNVCLNQFSEVPKWMEEERKINAYIPKRDYKDLGKFIFPCDSDDDVFLIDDDILYPDDYISTTIEKRERLSSAMSSGFVVGYHGTVYGRLSIVRFLINFAHTGLSFGEQVFRNRSVFGYHSYLPRSIFVSQLGTGTVLLKGSQLPPLGFMEGSERRVDVRFAHWCEENSLFRVCLERDADWIPHGGDDDISIWKTYTSQAPREFLSEICYLSKRGPKNSRDPNEIGSDFLGAL